MLGIICAMDSEIDDLIALMTEVDTTTRSGSVFHSGKLCGTPTVAVRCGVGKVNAAVCTQLMLDLFSVSAVVNSGVAGSLSTLLGIGDLVVASGVLQHDYDTTALGEPPFAVSFGGGLHPLIETDMRLSALLEESCKKTGATVHLGRIATGDRFVSSASDRLSLGSRCNAVACEMEGGAIGQVCARAAVPFAVLRCISDDITNNTAMDFAEFCAASCAISVRVMTDFAANYRP